MREACKQYLHNSLRRLLAVFGIRLPYRIRSTPVWDDILYKKPHTAIDRHPVRAPTPDQKQFSTTKQTFSNDTPRDHKPT